MPPRDRARRPPREQTRREILDAAARAFARRGFHGTSVEAVAAEAGLSTGAVYSNFDGKDDLFLKLYEERIESRARDLRASVTGAGGGAAGLAAAAQDVSKNLDRDRDWWLLYFEFALHASRDPAFAQRFAALRRQGLEALTGGVEDGLAHAQPGREHQAPELARAIRATATGFALERVLDEEGTDEALFATFAMLFRAAGQSQGG